ncbi:hypothetical protein FPANT_7251 [Fusarium pseudoanthophilum]|uniref:Uncharacterized protein n=1 Tax=Fusarium pseudoanthophilum TaxID=48495 RepID=A0A8H5L7S9_9HYPO|nr:hypothetical protein FPANT_7251 [Fusarium pseudoanthophilum]
MSTLSDLKPGQAQILSFFKPGLFPGEHTINVKQNITVIGREAESEDLETSKKFVVESISPYQLPAGSICSVYPGEGEVVEPRILPHIALSDAHVPWELSPDIGSVGDQFLDGSPIPWLALLVFTADELNTFPSLPSSSTSLSPSSTFACPLSKSQLKSLKTSSQEPRAQVPISDYELDKGPSDLVNTIFVKSNAFRGYFSTQASSAGNEPEPAIARYSYFAHIRRSRSTRAQDSGTNSHGIILGHRAGPLSNTPATTAYAHLVSLMGVKDNLSWPEHNSSTLTALVSLHSWTFTWQSGGRDIEDIITKLKDNVRPLARQSIESIQNKWLKKRMDAGYTFVKHRMLSGETTVALLRGPLIPHRPQARANGTGQGVNHGSGLQIIDSETGIIDISYSTAWSLGRSLALANLPFTAAVSALRSQLTALLIKGTAEDSTSKKLPDWFQTLRLVPKDGASGNDRSDSGRGSRWKRSQQTITNATILPLFPTLDITPNFKALSDSLESQVLYLSEDHDWYARELSEPTKEGLLIAKILDFIYNQLLTLKAIPHSYLFPEPDILETEAVLSFYTDPIWLESLVDGALSIGNQSTTNEDIIRNEIKKAINMYLLHVEEDYQNARVPRWGVILCGRLLHSFSDLRIRTGSQISTSPQLLTSAKLTDQALLLLFNCLPSGFTDGLTITQPPHQQRFAAATTLTATKIHIQPSGVLPEDAPGNDATIKVDDMEQQKGRSASDRERVFDFESRCLQPMAIMKHYIEQATAKGGSYLSTGSSALLSFILGDKLQELNISVTEEQADSDREAPLGPFQLRVPPKRETVPSNSWANESKAFSKPTLGPSSGSVPLGIRPISEPQMFAMARESLTGDDLKSFKPSSTSSQAPAPEKEQTLVPSLVETSCRILRHYKTQEGTRAVDLLVVLKAGEDRRLGTSESGLQLRTLNVSFPLGRFVDTASAAQPQITLVGRDSARWVSGSAYVAGNISKGSGSIAPSSALVVKLNPRAATSVKKVDVGFLVSSLALSRNLDDRAELLVEEEYGLGNPLQGEELQRNIAMRLCEIGGLSEL